MNNETNELFKNCKTLDEIENVLLEHNKKKLNSLKHKIKEYDTEITQINDLISNRTERINYYTKINNEIINDIDVLKETLTIYKRKYTNIKKEFDEINRIYNYLKDTINSIRIKESEICPICLDEINHENNLTVSQCGHKFCSDCISEYTSDKGNIIKCPKCNTQINKNEFYKLKNKEILDNNNDIEINDLNNLIQKIKSTKIGNIIYYIKTNFNKSDKCIIFSQWESLLTKIGNMLKNEKINVLYCNGTVYQKKRAITSFQNSTDNNIICLSSKNSASGINLTSANKIIFIEPVYGTKEYRQDIENQAIGRAVRLGNKNSIEVLRFIIKDTIEEDIYNENEIYKLHETQLNESQLVLEL